MTIIFGDNRNASHRVSIKLVCIANQKLLLIRQKGKETFNLVWGGVDYGETIPKTIQREFLEETGKELWEIKPKLLHVEIKTFPKGGQFDGVVNIFYQLTFDTPFEVRLEKWVYEEYKRCSKTELESLAVSEHSNKELLLELL